MGQNQRTLGWQFVIVTFAFHFWWWPVSDQFVNCWQKLDDSHSLIFFAVICTLLIYYGLFFACLFTRLKTYTFFLLCCMNYACISIENQPLLMTRVCLVTWQALLSEHFILKMSSIVQDSIDLFLGNYVVDTNEGISKPSPLETHRDWRFMAVSLLAVLCCNLYFFLCIEFWHSFLFFFFQFLI